MHLEYYSANKNHLIINRNYINPDRVKNQQAVCMPYTSSRKNLKSPKFRKNLFKRLFPTSAKDASATAIRSKKGSTSRSIVPRTINQRTSGFVGAAGDAKFFDVAGTTYGNVLVPTITHLDVVTQGTTVNQREGKTYRLTSCLCRGKIYNLSTAKYNYCANYLVWDKQPNKALAAVLDVLEGAGSDAFAKRENQARFVILRRWSYMLQGEGANKVISGNYCYGINEYVRLPPDCIAQCTAGDTTGLIGNRISGALLFITTGSGAVGADGATTAVNFRINFADI